MSKPVEKVIQPMPPSRRHRGRIRIGTDCVRAERYKKLAAYRGARNKSLDAMDRKCLARLGVATP